MSSSRSTWQRRRVPTRMPPSPGPAVPEQDLDDARPLAPEGEQMARECVLLQRVLNQHRKPVHALPHVGLAQRQVHLHAGRNYHHRVVSRSATCRRTTSGSLPSGANTRRPSARSIAVMPLGNGSMCKASAAGWGFVLSVVCSLDSTTGASSAFDFRPYPNSARQRNKALVASLGARQPRRCSRAIHIPARWRASLRS